MTRMLTPLTLLLTACGHAAPAQPATAQAPVIGERSFAAKPFVASEIGRFESPFAMAFLPGGRLIVTEKAGHLKLRDASGAIGEVQGVPTIAAGGQGGLLDVAPAPDFATSRTIYLSYSEPRPGGSELALARAVLTDLPVFCAENAVCAPNARLDRLQVIWRSGSAGRGGQLGAIVTFAPDAKSLFLTSGERQRFTPAQDPDQALGKILHLTLDGKPWPGNPGVGKAGADTVTVFDPPRNTEAARSTAGRRVPARSPNTTPAETWSTGHRNPYGLAFDAAGRLWDVEMGPRGGDELNLVLPGRNYGWPLVSNGDNYDGVPIARHTTRPDLEAPRVSWNPVISPSSLLIYSGAAFPAWRGDFLIGGLSRRGGCAL